MDDLDVHYAISDGYHIAYQVLGEGPPDLVLIRSMDHNLDMQWEEPRLAAYFEALAGFGRVIMFDSRGYGMSDPFFEGAVPTLEEWAKDTLAVMDAVGSQRAAVVAAVPTATRAIVMAATDPERVSHLVLVDPLARTTIADDYPFGFDQDHPVFDAARTGGNLREYDAGPDTWTDAFRRWVVRYRRMSASPGTRAAVFGYSRDMDVRHVLPSVRVPVLIIACGQRQRDSRAEARWIAERLPDARIIEVDDPAELNGWLFDDPDSIASEIEQFVTGTRTTAQSDRVLATVLFTDIVESTRAAADMGDARWNSTIRTLDRLVADEVARAEGRLVKWTGDGHLATFSGPGRAVRCARAICASTPRLGLDVRAGLHTGEIEVLGDDIAGLAVVIAQRVMDRAAGGQVLVSQSVPPLVTGSRLQFSDLGAHQLKGVPGEWTLHEVVW